LKLSNVFLIYFNKPKDQPAKEVGLNYT